MSTNRFRRTSATLLLAAAIAVPAVTAGPALASGGGGNDIRTSGTCVGGGTWKLKAKHDDGRIEVEFEVDTNRPGQLWQAAMSDNGVRFFLGARRTTAPSGSFSIERTVANRAGVDLIRARATSGSRSCVGTVRL